MFIQALALIALSVLVGLILLLLGQVGLLALKLMKAALNLKIKIEAEKKEP